MCVFGTRKQFKRRELMNYFEAQKQSDFYEKFWDWYDSLPKETKLKYDNATSKERSYVDFFMTVYRIKPQT